MSRSNVDSNHFGESPWASISNRCCSAKVGNGLSTGQTIVETGKLGTGLTCLVIYSNSTKGSEAVGSPKVRTSQGQESPWDRGSSGPTIRGHTLLQLTRPRLPYKGSGSSVSEPAVSPRQPTAEPAVADQPLQQCCNNATANCFCR